MYSTAMIKSQKLKGYIMILTAASLWGLSGTVAQPILKSEIPAEWLVTIRMVFSGLLLILIGLLKEKGRVFDVWKDSQSRLPLFLFALIGILGSQYTFFSAIETGNAAIAALLQYLGPAFILIYVALRNRKIPAPSQFVALFLALLGTFLLVTGGSLQKLNVPLEAVIWGVSSAITLAFYTLQPSKILKKWGSVVVVGWGLLLGGIILGLFNPPFQYEIHLNFSSLLSIVFIIVLGTLVPYYLFIDSLRLVQPSEASIISTAEPLVAVIASVVWLNVPFGIAESFGTIAVLSAVTLLALRPQN